MTEPAPPAPPGASAPGERLESWKEIAAYLGRSARTVQRWERQEGLPVHRLVVDKLGSVYAYRSELDAWWRERGAALGTKPDEADPDPAEATPELVGAATSDRATAAGGRGAGPSARAAVVFAVVSAVAALAVVGALLWRRALHDARREIRLAVLPFQNLTGDAEQDFLTDGLTEELITELGRRHPAGVGVIARSSVMRFKGAAAGLDRVGRELDVDYVLEGSVRRAPDRLRVAVKLVRVPEQVPVWAESYERAPGELLDVEADVARQVGAEIRLKLASVPAAATDSPPPSPRPAPRAALPEAHEAYLRARHFWNQRTEAGFRKAEPLFREATEKDPSYAAAYAGLADCYSLMANYGVLPVSEAVPKARAALSRALALDEGLAEAHASRAFILRNYDWDFPAAEREFKRALAENPSYATGWLWYALLLESLGRLREARAAILRARDLDPLSPTANGMLVSLALSARDYTEALARARRVLEIEPDSVNEHMSVARALTQLGRYDEAFPEIDRTIALSESHPMAMAVKGYIQARAGMTEEARGSLRTLHALSAKRHVAPYYFAVVHAGLGENDEALDWLDKVYEERHVGVLSLKMEPEFDGLHREPRFKALLEKVGLSR